MNRVKAQRPARFYLIVLLTIVAIFATACGSPSAALAPAQPTAAAVPTQAPAPTQPPAAPTATEPAMPAPTEPAGKIKALCGMTNGQAATGEPINVGAVVGATGPADFSSAAKGAAAYFKCVNANGGINGRPVNYIVEDDAWNPEQAAQVAAKLVNDDKVVAMVGSTSFVECAANAKFYKDSNIVVIAGVGVPRECFESENIAPTNQGPRLSTIGAVQYMNKTYGAKSFVCMAPNIPNMGNWSCDGIGDWGKDKGITVNQVIFDPATMDPTSLVLQAASFNPDAIITTMPAPVAIALFKAAEEQDLRDKYHWFGPTSLYDLAFPSAVGSYWDNKIDVQIELANIDSTGADNQAWLKIMDTYADAKDPRDSFSQAGYLAAKIFTDSLLSLDPAKIDRAAVTNALRAVKGYQSDLLCGPWYFGSGTSHNANHAGRMVQLIDGGKWKVTNDCFEVEDPALAPILKMEKSEGLTQ